VNLFSRFFLKKLGLVRSTSSCEHCAEKRGTIAK
jgi:hypothetical protein